MFLNNNYSFLSKSLHHLALRSNIISEMLFDIEMFFFNKKLHKDYLKPHLFVSGLPRSGTTILMRSLYETNYFASLTYRDMPFVLAPNIWSKITGQKNLNNTGIERAHKDRIKISIDSPEALDEVFWRVKLKKNYVLSDKLILHQVDDETIEEFRNFVSLILYKCNKKIYLSKNNNNLLRLESIIRAFPNCLILIPFRDPIQQSNSLLTQHKNFIEIQKRDKFVKNYMSYLVHYEFGADHRPYEFVERSSVDLKRDSIEYWLDQWTYAYNYLSQEKFSKNKNIIYLNYETICRNPKNVFNIILKKINLENFSLNKIGEFDLSYKKIEKEKSILSPKTKEIFDKLKKLNDNFFN